MVRRRKRKQEDVGELVHSASNIHGGGAIPAVVPVRDVGVLLPSWQARDSTSAIFFLELVQRRTHDHPQRRRLRRVNRSASCLREANAVEDECL